MARCLGWFLCEEGVGVIGRFMFIERYEDAINLTERGGELMTLSFGPDFLELMLLLLYWDKSGI